MIDLLNFFHSVRASFGKLSQPQVDGFNAILAATRDLPLTWRAYVLATAWHETAETMQPIHERGAPPYFAKYGSGTRLGKLLGNTEPGDGYRFRGRGYVQLTGRANYAKAGQIIGVDLVHAPELALDPDNAARIAVEGMTGGWFTGKSLTDYLPRDYVQARRIINGLDRAAQIASYAIAFEKALNA